MARVTGALLPEVVTPSTRGIGAAAELLTPAIRRVRCGPARSAAIE